MIDILTYTIGNNSIQNYLTASGVFIAVFLALKLVRYIVVASLKKVFAKVRVEMGDLLIKIVGRLGWPLFLVISIFTAVKFIHISSKTETVLSYVLTSIVVVYVILSMHFVVDYVIHRLTGTKEEEEEFERPTVSLLSILAKIALWVMGFVFILSNMGFNVTTLIAGFGIGGLVIAFGLQKIMQDLFASFSIYIDKAFVPGDFIIIGGDLGVVKKVGIKSTRIQHLGGQELVVSNRELTDTRIHNYKKMERRRIAFSFGVVYQTPLENLEKIPDMIKEIIADIETAVVDRVHFKEYGSFSLNFEVVYYVTTPDYAVYMDTQQKINLAMKKKFREQEIEFAYPTQKLFVEREINRKTEIAC